MSRLFDNIILYGFLIIGIATVMMTIDMLIELNSIDWVKALS